VTYSCSDFVDSIIDALGAHIPQRCQESPSDQADICLDIIDHMEQSNKALLAVAKNLKTTLAPFRGAGKGAGKESINALINQADTAIKLAETPPARWPDEDNNDDEEEQDT